MGKGFSNSSQGNVFWVHSESEIIFNSLSSQTASAEERDQKWNAWNSDIHLTHLKETDRKNKISDVFYSKVFKRNKTEKANNLIKCTVQKCLLAFNNKS